jgi:hypothetical protein
MSQDSTARYSRPIYNCARSNTARAYFPVFFVYKRAGDVTAMVELSSWTVRMAFDTSISPRYTYQEPLWIKEQYGTPLHLCPTLSRGPHSTLLSSRLSITSLISRKSISVLFPHCHSQRVIVLFTEPLLAAELVPVLSQHYPAL